VLKEGGERRVKKRVGEDKKVVDADLKLKLKEGSGLVR
jgi:hypothetical protein